MLKEIKVIGAQGLGPLGDRTKRVDRHEVPEESTPRRINDKTTQPKETLFFLFFALLIFFWSVW